MKKIYSILVAIMALATAAAAPLTPEQALQRMSSGKGMHKALAANRHDRKLVHTEKNSANQPSLYIFDNGSDEGYIILSADDAAAPVLGYSTSGSFDAATMPEQMQWWLSEYARRIEYGSAAGLVYEVKVAAEGRHAIEPMIKTAWDQTEPFNDLCPLSGQNRTYTGCVATTMAQVMKYWEYPEIGQGSISYNDANLNKRLTLDFSKRGFDWDLMLDSYTRSYTEEQADAVAYLMRACGFSVKMNYHTSASSAYALSIANAMVKYFNYDPNAWYAVRSFYTSTEWDQLIYDNLANVGPIPYGGSSMLGGGHSFVCDGYDGNGYYHFNWGWSGISNGYFLLDALMPDNLGAGGGSGGGYCFGQDAVLGVQPPTGDPVVERPLEIVQAGSLDATIDGSIIRFSLTDTDSGAWLNYSPHTIKVQFGAIFEPVFGGDAIVAPIDRMPITLRAGYGTSGGFVPEIDLSELDLTSSVYRVRFAADIQEEESQGMVPVHTFYGFSDYVTLRRFSTESDWEVVREKPSQLKIADGGFLSPVYFNCLAHVTATVVNDTDKELSCGLAPVLYYYKDGEESEPQLYFIGESRYVTVAPHSTATPDWITDLMATTSIISMNHDADLMLSFLDEGTFQYYTDQIFKSVVMHPTPGQFDYLVSDLGVSNADVSLERVDGKMVRVWNIENPASIPVEFTFRLRGTVPFYYRLMACLFSATPEADGTSAIYSYSTEPVILEPGMRHNFSSPIPFPAMRSGEMYCIVPAFIYGSNFIPLSDSPILVRWTDESDAVEQIVADESDVKDALIYNMQGISVGMDIQSLPSGIYIRNGKKILKH